MDQPRIVNAMIEIHKCIGGPDLFPEFFAQHNLAWLLHQNAQNLQRLILEFDLARASSRS